VNKLVRLEKIQDLVSEFSHIANEISELWNGDFSDKFTENYPFDKSFDEVASEIERWRDSVSEETVTIRVGVYEVYEQMHEVEVGSTDEIHDAVATGESVISDEFEFVEIDSKEPFRIYD